jgi:FkbM family methyltransferase
MINFSIVIPTYNRSSTIARAIKSVLNQTQENWELIIIDDGSNDSTKDIVSRFRDGRISYYKFTKNKGVNSARNKGAVLAKGNWIGFLDSDDEYMEDSFSVIFSNLNKIKNTVDIVGFMNKELKGGLMSDQKYLTEDSKWVKYYPTYEDVVLKKGVTGDIHHFINRRIFRDGFRFPEEINGFELLFFSFLLKNKRKIIYINRAVVLVHSDSVDRLSQKPYLRWPKQFVKGYIKFTKDHYNILKKYPGKLVHYYLRISKCYFKLKNPKGLYWFFRAMFISPSLIYIIFINKIKQMNVKKKSIDSLYYIYNNLRKAGRFIGLNKIRFVKRGSNFINNLFMFIPIKFNFQGKNILIPKSSKYFFKNYYNEKFTIDIMRRVLKEGDNFFDIGANIGIYSYVASDLVGTSGGVFSFEPDVRNFKFLKKNLKLYNNIKIYDRAVSNKSGSSVLNLDLDSSESSLIAHKSREKVIYKKNKVTVITLDDFVDRNKIEKVNVVKIDIEGGEPLVLMGMKNILNNSKKIVLFVEACPKFLAGINYDFKKLVNYLKSFNLSVYGIDDQEERLVDIRGIVIEDNHILGKDKINLLAFKGIDINCF